MGEVEGGWYLGVGGGNGGIEGGGEWVGCEKVGFGVFSGMWCLVC